MDEDLKIEIVIDADGFFKFKTSKLITPEQLSYILNTLCNELKNGNTLIF